MPRLELTPSEYFRRNFAVTTSGIDDPDVLGLVLRAIGEDNVMFAVDTPYEDPAAALAFLHVSLRDRGERAAVGRAGGPPEDRPHRGRVVT